ncbi:MAG: hypothetical protein KGI04_00875 [Candidatus Micrarchaeota archaeon]|nr:hypothetical protein [Candidatus Micrarchaeota archaeon]
MAISQKFLFSILMLISLIFIIGIYLLDVPAVFKLVLAVLALAFDLLAFSTKLYMSFFIPFLKAKNRTVTLEADEAFNMAPSGNAIVVRRGGSVYASAFITIPTYRSATEMNNEEKIDFARLFSRALTISKSSVKFATQLYVINKDAYISNIRGRLDEAEEKYQNASMNPQMKKADSERTRGEATMWHNLYDNVNKVGSQALEAFAMVSAEGGTEEEAINLVLQRADEIASGVSSVFGVSAAVVEGEDLLRFVEPDHMIPPITVGEQLREKNMAAEM